MSQQNPIIPSATQAKGIDAVIVDLQQVLSNDLDWLTNGMGRAYRRQKTRSNGALEYIPLVYLGTSSYNYFNATPDNDKEGQSIMIVGDGTNINFQRGFYGWKEYPVSILFSANLDTINSALLATEDFTQHLMDNVSQVLTRSLVGKAYQLEVTEELQGFEATYAEFDISIDKTSKPLLPMTYFRFECTITVKEDCPPTSLNRCTAITQNLTADDKNECILPTYVFSDTVVQGNVTAQQQTDLINWLCSSPVFSNDYSITFDALNEYIDFSDDAGLTITASDSFTFTCRIETVIGQTAIPLGNFGAAFTGYLFYVTTGKITISMYTNAGNNFVVESVDLVTMGDPTHIAMTYDGTGPTGVRMFIDGAESAVNTASSVGTPTVLIVPGSSTVSGRNTHYASYGACTLNVLRGWKIALTPAQILLDYNGDSPTYPIETASQFIGNDMGDLAPSWQGVFVFPDTTGVIEGSLGVNIDLTNRVAAI